MRKIPNIAKITVAAAAVSAFAGPAWAAGCALQDEIMALDTRVLQSELVVAALHCGHSGPYNAFVRKFEPVLVADGVAFRNYFNRIYGPHGEQVMDETVTRLANYAEMRSWTLGTSYCANAAAVFGTLLSLDTSQLAIFARSRPYVRDHGVEPCAVEAAAPAAAQPSP